MSREIRLQKTIERRGARCPSACEAKTLPKDLKDIADQTDMTISLTEIAEQTETNMEKPSLYREGEKWHLSYRGWRITFLSGCKPLQKWVDVWVKNIKAGKLESSSLEEARASGRTICECGIFGTCYPAELARG